jgi:hypothetical protein
MNSHLAAIPAFSACSRPSCNHFSPISRPITHLAPSNGHLPHFLTGAAAEIKDDLVLDFISIPGSNGLWAVDRVDVGREKSMNHKGHEVSRRD